jgi:ketosteroid isomerase-like protein
MPLSGRANAAKAISFYADDAVMMLDQGSLLEGKQAIQGLLEAMINAKLLPVTKTIIEARTSGDLGFVAGTLTFRMGGGPSIAAKGISFWKRVNGQWKIAYDILNRTGAPPKP